MKKTTTVSTLALLLLLVSCSKDSGSEFFQKENLSVGVIETPSEEGAGNPVVQPEPVPSPSVSPQPPVVVTPPDVPVAPQEIQIECAKAIQDGTLKERIYNLKFAPVLDCPWGMGGNKTLAASKNCSYNARAEIEKRLVLPSEAKRFCDLNIKFVNDKQSFDDEVLVTLQDYVLISSQDYSSSKISNPAYRLVRDSDGLMKYDWSKLFTAPYYKGNACPSSKGSIEHYCAGYLPGTAAYVANCKLPPTEKVGAMSIVLPKEAIFKLSSKIGLEFDQKLAVGQEKELSLKIITLGDNDKYDCAQNGGDMTVRVQYID